MRLLFGSLSALLLLGVAAPGCGNSDDGSNVGNGNGNGNGDGTTGPGVVLGDGTSGPLGSGSGTVIDPKAACATGSAAASLSGVNMLVMFDRSTSMNMRANQNGTRWQVTSKALTSFFASADAAGLQLALRFFPHDSPAAGCNSESCDAGACSKPLVDLGMLTAAPGDAQEAALIDATNKAPPAEQTMGPGMQMMMTSQGTPIFAALDGALQWAKAQHQKTPNENSVVVLVTDGEAHGCDENIDHISKLAADALAADGTRTYAIGLTGSQVGDMNRIAMAGGTTKGIFVSDGANTEQALLDALGAIRGQILDCDFPVPAPKPGATVNLNEINVNFTNGAGVASTFAQVGSEAQCTGVQGWYYDDPAAPKRIVLCKSTCDTVAADKMAKLDILLGCATVTTVPK